MIRILVLDATLWREKARDCLQQRGYRVDPVGNLAHLKKALARCPDVVLLGFPSVGPHAERIVEYTLEICPRAIVLVFSTSWPVQQSAERRLLRLGAADVMGRPGDNCELAELVEAELSARSHELASLSSYGRFQWQGAKQ